jgi:hypothetical protein
MKLAHRISVAIFRGSSTAETIHHRCGNKRCVNPEHLEPMEWKKNKTEKAEDLETGYLPQEETAEVPF